MNSGPGLIRLLYLSRHAVTAPSLPAVLASIQEGSARENPLRQVTGLLVSVGHHFLQVLEGPHQAVENLFEKIRHDVGHREVRILVRTSISARCFLGWSTACVERAFGPEPTDEQITKLCSGFASYREDDAPRYFKEFCLRQKHNAHAESWLRVPPAVHVVFTGASSIWSAALLSTLASVSQTTIARAALRSPITSERSTLLEYADIVIAENRPSIRAFSLTGTESTCTLIATLIHRPALVVLLVSTSDLSGFPDNLRTLLAGPQSWMGSAPVLLICNTSAEQLAVMSGQLAALTSGPVSFKAARLSDTNLIRSTMRDEVVAASRAVSDDVTAKLASPLQTSIDAVADKSGEMLTNLLALINGGLWAIIASRRTGNVLFAAGAATAAFPNYPALLCQSLLPVWQMFGPLNGDEADLEEFAVTVTSRLLYIRPIAGLGDQFVIVETDRTAETLALLRLKVNDFARQYLTWVNSNY